jgi:hypothetical protein
VKPRHVRLTLLGGLIRALCALLTGAAIGVVIIIAIAESTP